MNTTAPTQASHSAQARMSGQARDKEGEGKGAPASPAIRRAPGTYLGTVSSASTHGRRCTSIFCECSIGNTTSSVRPTTRATTHAGAHPPFCLTPGPPHRLHHMHPHGFGVGGCVGWGSSTTEGGPPLLCSAPSACPRGAPSSITTRPPSSGTRRYSSFFPLDYICSSTFRNFAEFAGSVPLLTGPCTTAGPACVSLTQQLSLSRPRHSIRTALPFTLLPFAAHSRY